MILADIRCSWHISVGVFYSSEYRIKMKTPERYAGYAGGQIYGCEHAVMMHCHRTILLYRYIRAGESSVRQANPIIICF